MMRVRIFLFLYVFLLVACDRKTLGEIEFFGYKGFNVESIRMALPLREGDRFPPHGVKSSDQLKEMISGVVKKTIGREPTDVAFVCCDARQAFLVYIGLPGESSQRLALNPAPTGDVRFSAEIVKSHEAFDSAWAEAVMKGKAAEDDSQGYTLTEYPPLRSRQLAMRDYALANEMLIREVLGSSSVPNHRRIAALMLGYARQSNEQMDALVHASLDVDGEVRNNAIRALWVLAGAKPDLARRVPATPYIQMLKSGEWSDHNKATLLLGTLTKSRDPEILRKMREEALDSLVEMARWRSAGHAYEARLILGRIAGIEEEQLTKMVEAGDSSSILDALQGIHR